MKQEIRAYDELLDLIHNTCDDLRRALVGEIVVSEVLEDTQRTLLMDEIPRLWKVSYFELILVFDMVDTSFSNIEQESNRDRRVRYIYIYIYKLTNIVTVSSPIMHVLQNPSFSIFI